MKYTKKQIIFTEIIMTIIFYIWGVYKGYSEYGNVLLSEHIGYFIAGLIISTVILFLGLGLNKILSKE